MDWEEQEDPSLQLPLFFFSVKTYVSAFSNNEYDPLVAHTSDLLARHWGNRDLVSQWQIELKKSDIDWSGSKGLSQAYTTILTRNDPEQMMDCICQSKEVRLLPLCSLLSQHANHQSFDRFIPVLVWNGPQSRFHQWLFSDRSGSLPKLDMVLWSTSLGLGTFIFSLFLSITFGLLLVWYPFPVLFRLMSVFSHSIPSFAIVVIFFSLTVQFTPGYYLHVVPPADYTYLLWYDPLQIVDRLWLPVFAAGLAPACYLAAVWEQAVRAELGQDYVRTLKAKGMGVGLGLAKHVLTNALFAPMGVMSFFLPSLLAGSLVMENLFSIPGMGRELMILWQQKNFASMLAFFAFQASIAVFVWALFDAVLAWADPRVRYEE